jgi:hypothetical protein
MSENGDRRRYENLCLVKAAPTYLGELALICFPAFAAFPATSAQKQ